jgi:hypothetical protein
MPYLVRNPGPLSNGRAQASTSRYRETTSDSSVRRDFQIPPPPLPPPPRPARPPGPPGPSTPLALSAYRFPQIGPGGPGPVGFKFRPETLNPAGRQRGFGSLLPRHGPPLLNRSDAL